MDEVELECAVYNEGTVFPVKIARDADVEALQETIAGVLSTEQHTVPPRLLALYLARKKEGEEVKWMKHDRNTESILQGGIDTGYDKMLSSCTLDDEELFGEGFQPGRKEIHVLVKLPSLEMPPTKKQIVDDGEIQQMLKLVQGLDRDTGLAAGTLLETPSTFLGVDLEKGLYVRQEYWDVYTILNKELENEEITRVLLIGSPGIGKSVFGVFLLLLFMSEHKDVAYRPLHKREELHYFTWNTENECYDVSLEPVRGRSYEGLFDGDDKGGAWYARHFVHSYLFASPRTKNYNSFVKEDCTKIYMNPWTTEECKRYVDKVVNPSIQPGADIENEWFMRYNIIGGKPRLLFPKRVNLDALVREVETAIPATLQELKEVFHAIQTDGPRIYERSKHILFALFRNKEDPSRCFIDFASGIIDCKVSARFQGESMDEIKSYCMTSSPLAQAWRGGYLCERLLLENAATSKILVRPLEGEDVLSARLAGKLGPYEATSEIFQGVSEVVAKECLYRPLAKNFPAIDGVLVVPREKLVIYLQTTVSLRHSIQHEALKDAIEILVKEQGFADYTHIFLFLVDSTVETDTYDQFEKQRFKTINNEEQDNKFEVVVTQYVGKIDNNETGSAAPSPSSHNPRKRTRREVNGEESDGFSSEGDTTQRGGTKNPKPPAKRRSSTKTSSRSKKRKASN